MEQCTDTGVSYNRDIAKNDSDQISDTCGLQCKMFY